MSRLSVSIDQTYKIFVGADLRSWDVYLVYEAGWLLFVTVVNNTSGSVRPPKCIQEDLCRFP